MIITPNSCARKGKKETGEVKGEYGGVCGEEEGNTDYGVFHGLLKCNLATIIFTTLQDGIWKNELRNRG